MVKLILKKKKIKNQLDIALTYKFNKLQFEKDEIYKLKVESIKFKKEDDFFFYMLQDLLQNKAKSLLLDFKLTFTKIKLLKECFKFNSSIHLVRISLKTYKKNLLDELFIILTYLKNLNEVNMNTALLDYRPFFNLVHQHKKIKRITLNNYHSINEDGFINFVLKSNLDFVNYVPKDSINFFEKIYNCKNSPLTTINMFKTLKLKKSINSDQFITLIDRNDSSGDYLSALGKYFNKIEKCVFVFVNKNIIKQKKVLDYLIRNNNIKDISLFGNLTDSNPIEFGKLIKNNSTINLSIGYKGLKDDTFINIFNELKFNTKLQKLNIFSAKQTKESYNCLGNALKLNSTLTDLNIENNSNFKTDGSNTIFKSLFSNHTLTKLNCSSCEINDGNCKIISNCLKVNKGLKWLSLSVNEITDVGFNLVMDSLTKNSTLKTLMLNYNKISFKESKSMIQFLKLNKSLTSLSISEHGGVNIQSINEFIENLTFNNSITELDLSSLSLDDSSSKILSNTLLENKCIQKIDVSQNKITNVGFKLIYNSLQFNKIIKSIDLSFNRFEIEINEDNRILLEN